MISMDGRNAELGARSPSPNRSPSPLHFAPSRANASRCLPSTSGGGSTTPSSMPSSTASPRMTGCQPANCADDQEAPRGTLTGVTIDWTNPTTQGVLIGGAIGLAGVLAAAVAGYLGARGGARIAAAAAREGARLAQIEA